MAPTLDPTLDVVFKLLFAAPKNRDILIALLQDVLAPERPIVRVDVLNPEIDKEQVDDRGLILDILAVHDDGSKTNIEMQARNRGDTQRRTLYDWARLYRDGIQRGDSFSDLTPCRVIFFLSFTLFEERRRLHSTFRVLETHDGFPLNGDLELHFVELTKLRKDPVDADDPAAAWAGFFAAKSSEERRRLSMSDPYIDKARAALEELSRDPKNQALVRAREDALRIYQFETASLKRKVMAEGLAEGRQKGLAEGAALQRRSSIQLLCRVLEIDWTPERARQVDELGGEVLEALEQHLATHRAWPQDSGD